MPTYGYECNSCRNEIEVFQSIKDDPLTTCESCGGTLRKRIYPVGIAFKGSGFYVNDYAPKSKSAPKSETAKTEAAPKVETPKTEAPAVATKTEAPAGA
jgi:putative FmdB family regulatory protein